MTESADDLLIEAATTAHRARDLAGVIQPHPAWADLTPEGRRRLHQAQLFWRDLERALDPDGLSTTARAVLARARNLRQ